MAVTMSTFRSEMANRIREQRKEIAQYFLKEIAQYCLDVECWNDIQRKAGAPIFDADPDGKLMGILASIDKCLKRERELARNGTRNV